VHSQRTLAHLTMLTRLHRTEVVAGRPGRDGRVKRSPIFGSKTGLVRVAVGLESQNTAVWQLTAYGSGPEAQRTLAQQFRRTAIQGYGSSI
jgi:hypothetical protein